MRRIPQDKAMHILAGAVAAMFGLIVGWQPAVTCCAAVAVMREIYNRQQGGKFDWRDIAATMLGGALVIASAAVGTDGIHHLLQGL